MAHAAWPGLHAGDFDTFVLDQDGVLFHGSHPVPGALATVQKLKRAGKRVVYVTNNSGKSRAAVAARLTANGVETTAEDVLTAGWAAAKHLASVGASSCYVVGEAGLVEELREGGLRVVGWPGDEAVSLPDADLARMFEEQGSSRPDAVVVGLDSHFTYRKLCIACAFVQLGAIFVGTNPDAGDRIGGGLAPGAGAMIAAVETVCGRRATVVGKPAATMIQHLLTEHALDASRTVMVGDRLDTDIAFGSAGGVKTCLVLTGVATQTEAEALPAGHPCRPDFLMPSLGDLLF
jgi:phosphoglycolate/pyridoxal phosphate phosphatase family enzyme